MHGGFKIRAQIRVLTSQAAVLEKATRENEVEGVEDAEALETREAEGSATTAVAIVDAIFTNTQKLFHTQNKGSVCILPLWIRAPVPYPGEHGHSSMGT